MAAAVAGLGVHAGAIAQEPGSTVWEPTFADEFSGAAGTAPDPAKWSTETGGNGWGNDELQTYTARPENIAQDGNGHLRITAKREPGFVGTDGIRRDYTSARLKTQGKFNQTYGRFEARLQLPGTQGIWPAFWMLGEDITSVGWPSAGEIDVIEHIGAKPDQVFGTIHGPGYSGGEGISDHYTLPDGEDFADQPHTFAVEWTPDQIKWFVDDNLYQTRTPADLHGNPWVYDNEFFLLLNVAVGGSFPGNPDGTTVFPQSLLVDYVRVSERSVVTRDQVDNGAFANAAENWDLSGNASVQPHDADAMPMQLASDGAGDSALKLFGTFDANSPETEASQRFLTLDPNDKQTLTAVVRTNSDDSIAGTDNTLVMFVAFYDNYDQLISEDNLTVLDGDSPADQWQHVMLDASHVDGAAYAVVGFRFEQPGVAGGAAWVDDVRFGAAVPEPAAALGIGSLAPVLLSRRRRRQA